MASFIRVSNAGKSYGAGAARSDVLRDVDFEIGAGEFVSILGGSGCGKSTLLMMVAGLEAISAGAITLDGEPAQAGRPGIGIIFQDATLLPWRSALENVLFPIEITRRPLERYRGRAQELLGLVGLEGWQDRKPGQLSGGMRQRVAICRALITEPALLLMDEPFSALDAITRDELNVVLLDLWQRQRRSALFVTHSIREAVLLSDRVIVLGGRPASVLTDLAIPFPRPRRFDIGETEEFNRLCSYLRSYIAADRKRLGGTAGVSN